MLLSAGAATGVVMMAATGAVAASFSVSGQSFKVSATKLEAHGFVQYGSVDARSVRGKEDPEPQPVAVSAMKTAKLTNLCQSVVTDLGFLGDYTLKISAGTGANKVTAENMVVDMSQLDGDAHFEGMEIGRDAATLDKGPTSDANEVAQRQQAFFSQQADDVTIDNLKQVAWATSAGKFNLYDLSLRLRKGKDECF